MNKLRFVLDCSVTLPWFFEDEADAHASAVLHLLEDGEAVVPTLWPLEVANGLIGAERRQRLSAEEVTGALVLLSGLNIAVEDGSPLAATILVVARTYGLTAYDAAYLELALREGLALATKDEQLIGAARRAGVALVETLDIGQG